MNHKTKPVKTPSYRLRPARAYVGSVRRPAWQIIRSRLLSCLPFNLSGKASGVNHAKFVSANRDLLVLVERFQLK